MRNAEFGMGNGEWGRWNREWTRIVANWGDGNGERGLGERTGAVLEKPGQGYGASAGRLETAATLFAS
jgi:hypothetical protein